MQFWTNFAKTGVPGSSSNGIYWKNTMALYRINLTIWC